MAILVLGTSSPGVCLDNISAGPRPLEPEVWGVGLLAAPSSVTSPGAEALQTVIAPTRADEAPSEGGLVEGRPGTVGSAWYPDIRADDFRTPEKLTPGYGEPYPVCGDVRFVITCPDNQEHHKRIMRENCKRSACPTCWPSWDARAAGDAASRIDGYRSATMSDYLPRHISLSPPPGEIENLQDLIDEGRKVVSVLGIKAAAVIPHPYRLQDGYRETIEELADSAGLNRYEFALSRDNWFDLVKFSPHLHLIVYGPLMDADEFHKQTGWTYRNHDAGSDGRGGRNRGRRGTELEKTLYYLLSHAWVRGNHKVVRYWLGLNTHQLKCTDVGYETKTESCPVCKTDCIRYSPHLDEYQDLHNAPVYTVKIRIYVYEVRAKRPRHRTRISAGASAVWGPAGPPVIT